MGKVEGSWSGMRKYLEKEMLAECLRGRIRYGCTAYVGMDGKRIFEICLDGEPLKRFSWETVNTYFIQQGLKPAAEVDGIVGYWSGFVALLHRVPMEARPEYTDEEFCGALEVYRSQGIQDSLRSDDPLVRMFAILDRRVGRRTLASLGADAGRQPAWLQRLYLARMAAQGLPGAQEQA